METLKQVSENLQKQFAKMTQGGIMPVLEYPIVGDDFITVDLCVDSKGVYFTFDDDGKDPAFSGEIKKDGDSYRLPFDVYFDNLDHYLQQIDQEIQEGYLIPHNLFISE